MAEIITGILNLLLEKPISQAYKEIMFAMDLGSHIKELMELKQVIEAALLEAPSPQSCFHSHQVLLDKLNCVLVDLEILFDIRATRAKLRGLEGRSRLTTELSWFISPSNQFVARFKDARKVKGIQGQVKFIRENFGPIGTIFSMLSGKKPQPRSEETGHYPNTDVLIGRDTDKDNLITRLCDSSLEPLSVVTVVGIGGQGKTTLAQYVFNDQEVTNHFEIRLWVFATPDVDLRELLEKIIASATNQKPFNCEKTQLQCQILEKIRGKRFLLVLDNIWDQNMLSANWLELKALLGVGASGSKVLVTTRSISVAKIMGPFDDPYTLNDLAKIDSLLLFKHYALQGCQELGLEEIGKEIVDLCPKVPLVLKVVGQHLGQSRTVEQWHSFKDKLAAKSFFDKNDMIMQTLKLSFDQLDKELQLCVMYCSLFGNRFSFNADEMVRIWMALGYINMTSQNPSPEEIGEGYVKRLASLGFFQDIGYNLDGRLFFRMHDVIHKLMVCIGQPRYQMIDSKENKYDDKVCHASLDWNRDSDLDVPFSVYNIKQLQSFVMEGDRYKLRHQSGFDKLGTRFEIRNQFDKLVAKFRYLKVLDLKYSKLEEVPRSLWALASLRYLDLSGNIMSKLPNSITQLVKLLSLELSCCRCLQELPRDMSKLYKLRYLGLYGCYSLTHMPKGLGKLKDLHTLNWFVLGKDSSSSSKSKGNVTGGLEELSELNNLKGELTIFVAEESKYVLSEATTAHLATNNLTKLNVVFNKSTKEDEMFLERLKPHGNKLTTMWIFDYGGEKLPSWMLDDQLRCQLPNLIQIKISDSDKIVLRGEPSLEDQPWLDMQISDKAHHPVEFIPGFSELKKQLTMGYLQLGIRLPKGDGSRDFTLRSLEIADKLAASPSREQNQPLILFNTCFPNLVDLTLDNIPELEVLPEEIRDLSSLKTLLIIHCLELQAIPDWIDSLTSLKHLYMYSCPKIESLPRQISKLSQLARLFIRGCPKELVERCRKPTGELWPHIQHINHIQIESRPDVNNEIHKFNSKNEQ